MAAPIKMDELLVSWLGSDDVYENVMNLIEKYRVQRKQQEQQQQAESLTPPLSPKTKSGEEKEAEPSSPRGVVIPPFYPLKTATGTMIPRRRTLPRQSETWEPLPNDPSSSTGSIIQNNEIGESHDEEEDPKVLLCVRDQVLNMLQELDITPTENVISFSLDSFVRITKEVCGFPSFFNAPLYQRILSLWSHANPSDEPLTEVTLAVLEWFWKTEMEPYDASERFFRLVKQPNQECILRDDFLPYIKALLNEHPVSTKEVFAFLKTFFTTMSLTTFPPLKQGLEFLSNHAEFQEKYAVTVITRIFYCVNKCHSGRITSRQVRRSDLLEAFSLVDEEEDINKVTRYFSYEHFYVLYCRFWELDHDRDYRIIREDLLKYGDHSLSHMIVDRIFDAAPRPFEQEKTNREFLSYEDFIYFMLSGERKMRLKTNHGDCLY